MASVARIGFGGVIAVGVAIGLLGLTATSAEGQLREGGASTPSLIFGAHFQIKSQVDNNFCIQAAPGTAEGRTITLQQCAVSDNQRWTLTHNSDDTNLIVDSQGMCLDARNRKAADGLALPVQKCRFGDAWRFTYTSLGLLKDEKNDKCLQVPGAAANAAVSLAACDSTKATQKWLLTH
jgi:hypothetical protein